MKRYIFVFSATALLAVGCNPFQRVTVGQDAQRAAVQSSPITTEQVYEAVPPVGKVRATLEFRVENLQNTASEDASAWLATGLTGAQVTLAAADYQVAGTEKYAIIRLEFNEEGKALFAKITKDNIGKRIGIFVDGELISAPTVQASITDGVAVIAGSFTPEEAETLAARLNTVPAVQVK